MLSEVAGNKMSFNGGATSASTTTAAATTTTSTSLSETSSRRHMEASPVPIKTITRSETTDIMPPPRNPNSPARNTAASASTTAGRRTNQLKVQDLNEFFICFLCGGYKIEATTINECMHSFCRSCIVKHLEVKHYCPECFHKKFVVNADGNGNMLRIGIVNSGGGGQQQNTVQTPRIITSQNLNLDRMLSALIYKSVPGLYQREMASVQKFYAKKSDDLKPIGADSHQCSSFERILFRKENVTDATEDPVYVSADEPISLSLEYHPKELQGLNPENMPKVQYLQCPAGVRIRHLEKFLYSKFSINSNEYSVDVIYDDRILNADLNLMDIVYCFNWKRDAPMRFFYRIFLTGQSEPPRMRMKMVVKDNDDTKKTERSSVKQHNKSEASSSSLPPITMRIKHDLHTNGTSSGNEKTHENKVKLSNIIGSSKEPSDLEGTGKLRIRRDDGVPNNCQQQISGASLVDQRRSSNSASHGKSPQRIVEKGSESRAGEKRKLKDEFEFVDEVTITKSPRGGKSPSASSMRSPHNNQQHSAKTVTFNDTVQATRIPFIKYVNPVANNAATSPPNDFKRLRSNDMVSTVTSSLPKVTTGVSSSSTSSTSVTNTTAQSVVGQKNSSSSSASTANDSSRITSGTVPDNNFKQFPSKQPPPPSTQLHTATAAAQQISKHSKSNTPQLHNNKLEKFPTSSSSSASSSLPSAARDETAIGNNRHQNSSNSSSATTAMKKKSNNATADEPCSNRQQQLGGAPKNDFNGNLRHEKNQNVALVLANNTEPSNKLAESERGREQREEDKYEYVKNIGLKPIHEVVARGMDVKNKDVDAGGKRKSSTTTESGDDPSSMLYHKKKKKSKHSKDFPFADMKKKKVDYDLAISSTNVPKASSAMPAKDATENRSKPTHHPDSLKMKFVKVTTNDKNNAKVMVIPKANEKDLNNGRPASGSAPKTPSPHQSVPPLATSSVSSTGSKSPKQTYSRVPKLGNFIIKDNSMEIHQIPKGASNPLAQLPRKSPSPPSLTITSTPVNNRGSQQTNAKIGNAPSLKRTESQVSSYSATAPPLKKSNNAVQNQRSMESMVNKESPASSPYLQRSYSYDPSVVMGCNYNLPLTQFQLQLATEMMLQKQIQQQWAAAAAANQAKQANANNAVPSPMVPFFNAPQSRSPPVNNVNLSSAAPKKPVPPLVPPSSLGANFGKYNSVPNLVASSKPHKPQASMVNRLPETPPMVEIVRLPPGLDKVEIPHIPARVPSKANRPPPPTIPLVKIRRASANSTSSTESGDGVTPNKSRDAPAVLDLSGKQSSFSSSSIAKGPGEKAVTSSQKPLPQLNEISKISRGGNALIHRQPSASVRSVPNPSALALRNQMSQPAKGSYAVTSSSSSAREEMQRPSMSPMRLSPPAMASFNSKSSNLEKLASKIKEGVSTTGK